MMYLYLGSTACIGAPLVVQLLVSKLLGFVSQSQIWHIFGVMDRFQKQMEPS